MSDSLQPYGLQPTRVLCPWDFPGKNTGVGCHFLLQGIFPTQVLNLGLRHCRQISYRLSHLAFHVDFLIKAILTSLKWYCFVVLICFSLVISDAEHLLWPLAICWISTLHPHVGWWWGRPISLISSPRIWVQFSSFHQFNTFSGQTHDLFRTVIFKTLDKVSPGGLREDLLTCKVNRIVSSNPRL